MILIYYIQNLVSKAARKDSDIAGMQNCVSASGTLCTEKKDRLLRYNFELGRAEKHCCVILLRQSKNQTVTW